MTAVLRVAGESFDVDAFLASHPDIEPEAVWHRGEDRHGGRTNSRSGFNLSVAEGATWTLLAEETLERLRTLGTALEDARRAGASMEIDFALFVGAREPVEALLQPAQLALLAEANVQLRVSAYPVSDEDDDEDDDEEDEGEDPDPSLQ